MIDIVTLENKFLDIASCLDLVHSLGLGISNQLWHYLLLNHTCEAFWLRMILNSVMIVLQCNTQIYMVILKSPVFHAHTKHILIQYHYVWELIEENVDLEYGSTYSKIVPTYSLRQLERSNLVVIFRNLALGLD